MARDATTDASCSVLTLVFGLRAAFPAPAFSCAALSSCGSGRLTA